MTERRCETCRHFVPWDHSFMFAHEGVCTCPKPEFSPKGDREVRKDDGQKCQTWAANVAVEYLNRAEVAEAENAKLREALERINHKATMNAGEFAAFVRSEIAALQENKP